MKAREHRWWWARAVLMLAVTIALPPVVQADPTASGMIRHWAFGDGHDIDETALVLVGRPLHGEFEYRRMRDGADQVRGGCGAHARDGRGSTYTLAWRDEHVYRSLRVGTEQVVRGPWVARADVSPIFADGEPQWSAGIGLDRYTGSYGLVSVSVTRDPRERGLWVMPMRWRLADERNDWVQLGFTPSFEGASGWSAVAKWRWLKTAVEANHRYDFTAVDNVIYTAGVDVPLQPPR